MVLTVRFTRKLATQLQLTMLVIKYNTSQFGGIQCIKWTDFILFWLSDRFGLDRSRSFVLQTNVLCRRVWAQFCYLFSWFFLCNIGGTKQTCKAMKADQRHQFNAGAVANVLSPNDLIHNNCRCIRLVMTSFLLKFIVLKIVENFR